MNKDANLSDEEMASFKDLTNIEIELNETYEIYSSQMEKTMNKLGLNIRGILRENIQLKRERDDMIKISKAKASILLREISMAESITQVKEIITRIIDEITVNQK